MRKEKKLQESDFISNNNKYMIDDIIVNKIYFALKIWHKSHCEIYDMTIDPLTAPKAISDEAMREFYKYVMKLKKMDLMLFKSVLLEIKKNPYLNINKYIDNYIFNTNDCYEIIKQNVKILYKKSNLNYNADTNPFI